jgi:hypothetical protein
MYDVRYLNLNALEDFTHISKFYAFTDTVLQAVMFYTSDEVPLSVRCGM